MPTLAPPTITEVEQKIGEYCASLVQDGDTIQLGIGDLRIDLPHQINLNGGIDGNHVIILCNHIGVIDMLHPMQLKAGPQGAGKGADFDCTPRFPPDACRGIRKTLWQTLRLKKRMKKSTSFSMCFRL